MRTVERLFRRAEVAICESEGFHPKPRVHYPASLALGMTGVDEVLEVDLAEASASAELLDRLNVHSVPGLEFIAIEPLPPQSKRGQPRSLRFEVHLSDDRVDALRDKVDALVTASEWVMKRDRKVVDIRPLVEELTLAGNVLMMQLGVVNEAGARPRDVLEALGLSADEIFELDITRVQVEMTT